MQCFGPLASSSYSSAAAYPSSLPASYRHNSFPYLTYADSHLPLILLLPLTRVPSPLLTDTTPSLTLPMPIPGQSDAFELKQLLNSAFWVLTERGIVPYTADKVTTQLVMLQKDVINCTFSHSK
jgi:hypothetical protein